ncbi:MAG: NADPH:quinone oxidoreductase family protein, partial [Actinomycetota bacterium]|nr:NADPH:quinone oxidoreductase family protein [Actinomycetota bacterium]
LGVLWGAYRFKAPQLIDRAWSALDELLAGGMSGPFIWKTLEFDQAADGLAELAAGRTMGRVVVRVAQ